MVADSNVNELDEHYRPESSARGTLLFTVAQEIIIFHFCHISYATGTMLQKCDSGM